MSKYKLRIGDIVLDSPFILAPMAGITNLPFRLMCKKQGASLVYSEMVSSDAIIRNNPETFSLMKTTKEDSPLSLQIFGCDSVTMKEAAKIIEKQNICDIIDINMGCPAKDIVEQGSGAALLKDLKNAEEIISCIISSVKIPVTAKIRIGINRKITAFETAKMLERCGVKAIAVHGRTTSQGYSGKADWETIKKVKESVNIPIIGNGDITKPSEAIYYLKNGYCDAIMIGRAAIGDPHIFRRMKTFFNDGELLEIPGPKEKIVSFFEYMNLCKKFKLDEDLGSMRTQAQYFTKGLYNSTDIREKLNSAKSYEEMKNILKNYLKKMNK